MFNISNNVKPSLSLDQSVNNDGTSNIQNQNISQSTFNQNNSSTSDSPNCQEVINNSNQSHASYNNNSNINNTSSNGVILSKGEKVSLSKFNPSLNEIDVCLGWDVSTNTYDLDSEAFILGDDGKVLGDDWFVFYNQTCSPDGSIIHSGDNKTGIGEGDDEIINIKLSKINPRVNKIVFVVTINQAKERGLNFSGVSNAFIRVVDKIQNRELVRFNLTEYYSNVTSMMVGELYKKNNEWRFNPIGNGTNDDLLGLCLRYGVNVAG